MSTRLLVQNIAADLALHQKRSLRDQRRADIRSTRFIALGLIGLGLLYFGLVLTSIGG